MELDARQAVSHCRGSSLIRDGVIYKSRDVYAAGGRVVEGTIVVCKEINAPSPIASSVGEIWGMSRLIAGAVFLQTGYALSNGSFLKA